MRAITYFRAYRQCQSRIAVIESRRGTDRGIAVHSDDLALRWQRYGRLKRKLVAKLEAMLGEVEK